jgi:hypothetical protein
MLEMFFLLLAGHALADYPLQGEFLAANKARSGPGYVPWWHALFAHALIHGGLVALITGWWVIGLAETVMHAYIDHLKCEGEIGINMDQFAHIVCKVAWVSLAVAHA